MTLPLRYRFPIAMGLSALIVSPFLAYSAEGELQLASTDRTVRPIVRTEPATERSRASTEAREVFETPQWGQVSGQMVNLRGGAGTQYMIVATMRSGDYLRAVAKVGNWIEVDWPEAAVAWVARDFVDAEGRVTGNNVRIRTAGNLNATILGEARKGDVLTVLGSSGDWYKIKAPQGAKAYIYGRYLLLGVRAPAHAAAPQPAPEPNEPAAAPEAPATPAEPAEIEEPAAPAAPVVSEAQPEPAAKPVAEVPIAAEPVPTLPAMELVAAPGIRMPSEAEAHATERNAPPILDLIEQETRTVPVVPPVVVEPVIVDAPAPEPEAPAAPKAPEEHTAVPAAPTPAAPKTEAAVTAARADTPAEAPVERPAEATATRTVLPTKPPEEDLWGDELPPPKRVILPPGARRAPNDETSEATPSAPAEREGGLIMGLLKDLQEDPQRIAVAPAEVVELPAAPKPAAPEAVTEAVAAPVAEPVAAPEPPAQPFVWKSRATRAPYLPRPHAEAPASLRLPGAETSQVGPVHATEVACVEGVLEAAAGPVKGCAFAIRADDGSLWHLKEGPCGEAATLLGARVSAVGRLSGYPNTQEDKVMDVSSLALAR